jgi:hypothetical protein
MRVLVVVLNLAFGALPPGYEDALFCPPLYCLQPKEMPKGFTGPRVAFVECVHEEDDSEEARVATPWGERSGVPRSHWEDQGYHERKCAAPLAPPPLVEGHSEL